MGPLRKKSWWQKVLFSRLTLVMLVISVFGLAFAVYDRYQVEREMAARRGSVEEELRRESDRQATLKDRVDYLKNDQGMEAEIRRHFDVALEGEQVIVIMDDKETSSGISAMSSSVTKEEESVGFWARWLPW